MRVIIVAGLLLGSLAAEVLIVGPHVGRAARSLSQPNPWWLLVALLAQVASLSAFAHLRRRMLFAGGTRVPVRRILVLTYAANAISLTLPAGAALSTAYTFRRLRSWGTSVPLASFTLIASGVLSSLAFALLCLSGALVAGADHSSPDLTGAAIVTAIGAVLLVRRLSDRPHTLVRAAERGLRYVNRVRRRAPESGLIRVHQLIGELSEIKPRHRDWLAGLLFAGLNWTADLLCLVASCRAVDAQNATIALVLIAYLAGMSMSSLSLLPGGLGVVEATMILALSHGGPDPHLGDSGRVALPADQLRLRRRNRVGDLVGQLAHRARSPGASSSDRHPLKLSDGANAGPRRQPRGRHIADRSRLMALSEHEKQVLDEIEQDLSPHNPGGMSSLHPAWRHQWASARPAHPLGLPSGLSLLLTGLAVLLLGVYADNTVGVLVGVFGYLVTFVALRVTLSALGRWRYRRRPRIW